MLFRSGLTLQFIGEYRPHTELLNLWGLHGIQLKDFDLTGLAACLLYTSPDVFALIERDLRQCKFDSAAMKTVEALDGKL